MSDFGKRGGTSANAGRKAATYTVEFPDGTTAKKRTYFPSENDAGACYLHDGKWYVAGIYPVADVPRYYVTCKATRQ